MERCVALGHKWLCIGDQRCSCNDDCGGGRVCRRIIAGGAWVLYAVDRFTHWEIKKPPGGEAALIKYH
jgi:hypothetical protein